MTRNTLFTSQKSLMMHLCSIGSVGVITSNNPDVAFDDQQVQEVTLDKAETVEQETILQVKDAGLDVGAINFNTGQVVFVSAGYAKLETMIKH